MASSRIKGITIEIGSDTVGLQKALADVNKQSNKLQSELKDVERLLKFNPGSAEALSQKQKLLANQVETTTKKLNQLKEAEQQVQAQFTNGKISEEQYRAFRREIEFTEGSLDKLKNSAKSLDKEIDDLSRGTENATKSVKEMGTQLQDVGGRMQSSGSDIATSFGAATAVIGGGLAVAAKKAMDFESQMSSVKSVMAPDEVKEFGGELEKLAVTMGAKTKYSATEAAQGIEELVKAGVSVKDVMNGGLDGALSLATAGELDLASAAEIASTALNAFKKDNLSVSKAADILAGAANASATNVEELRYGLSMVSAVASGVGLTFKDTSTALAVFAQNGLKGSDAGTSLKTMLLNLQPSTKDQYEQFASLGLMVTETSKMMQVLKDNGIKPLGSDSETLTNQMMKLAANLSHTKEGSEKANNEYLKLASSTGALHSSFYDANGSLKDMSEIAGILNKSLSGMGDAQRQAALRTMFGTDAIRAGNILYKEGAKGIDEMAKNMDKIKAADVAKQKLDNVKGSIEQLKGSLETAGIALGTALLPAIKSIAEMIGTLVDKFNGLSPTLQRIIAIGGVVATVLLGIVTAIGALTMLIGGAITGLGALTTFLFGAGEAVGFLSRALTFMTGPIGLTIAAVIALIAIFVALYKNNEDFRNKVNEIWTSIKNAFKVSLDFIKNIVHKVMTDVMAFFGEVLGKIKDFWSMNGTAITGIVKGQFNTIFAIIKGVMGIIKGVFQVAWPIISGVVQIAWGLIKTYVKVGLDVILGLIRVISKLLQGDWKGAWNAIKDTAKNIWNDLEGFFKSVDLVQIGKDIINGLIKGIASMSKAAINAAHGIAKSVKDTVTSFFDIHSPSRVMQGIGQNVSEGLANGIQSGNDKVTAAAKKAAADAKKAFQTGLKNIQLRVDAKKLSVSDAIDQLEKLKTKYKSVPNAVETVNKEIYQLNQQLVKKNEELYKQRFEAQKAQIQAQLDQHKISLNQELKAYQRFQSQYKKGTEERKYWDQQVYDVKKKIFDSLKALNDEYAQKVKDTNQKLKDGEIQAEKDYNDKIKSINDRLNEDLLNSQKDYASQVQGINDKLAQDEQALTDAYKKAVNDRTKALYDFAGIFDKVSRKDVNGQELIDNLSSQVDAFKDYQSNIESLSSKGVDQGLIQELKDAGPKSVDQIKALNSLSADQLQQYVVLWQEKSSLAREQAIQESEGLRLDTAIQIQQLRADTNVQLEQLRMDYVSKVSQLRNEAQVQMNLAKTEWVNTVAQLRLEANDQMTQYQKELKQQIEDITKGTKDQFDVMSASMKDIGNNAMQGLMKGLADKTSELYKQAQSIANTVSSTIKKALDIHSPSRVMMEIGQYTGEGLAIGMSQSIKDVSKQASEMAKAVIPTIDASNYSVTGESLQGNSSSVTSYGDIHITIPARDIQEFNNVVDFFNRLPQANRAK